jgi:hypothetical protein
MHPRNPVAEMIRGFGSASLVIVARDIDKNWPAQYPT